MTRFVRGQCINAPRVESDAVLLEVSRHDPLSQRIVSQHIVLTESGARFLPVQIRYAWPAATFSRSIQRFCFEIGRVS